MQGTDLTLYERAAQPCGFQVQPSGYLGIADRSRDMRPPDLADSGGTPRCWGCPRDPTRPYRALECPRHREGVRRMKTIVRNTDEGDARPPVEIGLARRARRGIPRGRDGRRHHGGTKSTTTMIATLGLYEGLDMVVGTGDLKHH